MTKQISRRSFLKGSLAATGLTIVASATPLGIRLVNASGTKEASLKPSPLFEITPDNVVKFIFPNSEMGQGSKTGHTMILADELEADWDQIEVLQAPAAKAFGNPIMGGTQITVASAATRGWYAPLRKMGAAGKTMLVETAAKKWAVPSSQCKAMKGTVVNLKTGRKLTYGQLCLDAAKFRFPRIRS